MTRKPIRMLIERFLAHRAKNFMREFGLFFEARMRKREDLMHALRYFEILFIEGGLRDVVKADDRGERETDSEASEICPCANQLSISERIDE